MSIKLIKNNTVNNYRDIPRKDQESSQLTSKNLASFFKLVQLSFKTHVKQVRAFLNKTQHQA